MSMVFCKCSRLIFELPVRLLTVILSLLVSLSSLRAEDMDLNTLMQDENYIRAYLIIVSPGNEIYSTGGHVALRMTCPSQDVDYVYEFDALSDEDNSFVFDYLNGTLRGSYVRIYASHFYNTVTNENRTTDEYPLNLKPEQEVSLWSILDDAVDGHTEFPFTPSKLNCCSMMLTILETSLHEDLFNPLMASDTLSGSGRKYLDDFFSNSEWTGLFWNIILGIEFDFPREAKFLFYPKNLVKYLRLIKNPANNQNLIAADSNTTAFNSEHPIFSSPEFVFILILALSAFITWMNIKGKLRQLSQALDIILLMTISLVGCLLWYIFFTSLVAGSLYFNVLMILFTPIPFILVVIHKTKTWTFYAKATSATCLILIICTLFYRQLQLYWFWLFLITILIRAIYYLYSNNPKSKFKTELHETN